MSLNTIITLNNEDTEKCINFFYTRNKDFETINVEDFFNNTDMNVGLRIAKETNEKLYMTFDIFDKKNCDTNVLCPVFPDLCAGIFGLYSFTKNHDVCNIIVEPAPIKYKDLYDAFHSNLQVAFDINVESYIKCIKFNLEKDNVKSLWKIFYPILSNIHKRKISDVSWDLILRKLNYYGYTKELTISKYELLYKTASINVGNFEEIISGLLIYIIDYNLNTNYKDNSLLEKISRISNDLSTFYFENIF